MPLFCITETGPSKMHNVRPCVFSRPWLGLIDTLKVENVASTKSRESREKCFATFIEKVASTKCREGRERFFATISTRDF